MSILLAFQSFIPPVTDEPPLIVQPQLPPRLHPHARCDNGRLVLWGNEAAMAMALNKVVRYHNKQVFARPAIIASVPASAGAGQRKRWRCAFHTGPYTDRLVVSFVMAPTTSNTDARAKFEITGGNSCEFRYGAGMGVTTVVPNTLGYGVKTIDVNPDTSYDALFSDYDNGRLVGACVSELALAPDPNNGYLDQYAAVQAPIFLTRRSAAMAMANSLWKRGAAHCFSWSVDTDSDGRNRTLTTDMNLIDNSTTTVSTSSPGVKLDLQYKRTRMRTTVPVRVRACGLTAGGGTGHVYLKDSGGTALLTINITGATEAWFTGDVDLPATEAKYDIHYDGDGTNQTTVRAVSMFEYLT